MAAAVAGRLKRWLRERVKVVVCVDAEQQRYVDDSLEYRGLPPWLEDTEMLYLGDLGFLDRQRIGKARWYEAGRELHCRNVRVEALVTADPSDWDGDFMRYYHLHGWESGRIVSDVSAGPSGDARGESSRRQLQRLMAHLSQALEVTPALVRTMRLELGLNVSVESLVFQHRALIGNRFHFQWRSTAHRDGFREQFEELGGDRGRSLAIIRRFEAALPMELQIEQRQQLSEPLTKEQEEFVLCLVKSQRQGCLSDDAQAMLLGWIGRMAQRAGRERWSEETRMLYALYWQKNKQSPDCIVPEGIDPIRLPRWITGSAGSGRHLRLMQQGDRLALTPLESDSPLPGVELTRFEWFEGTALRLHGEHGSDKRPLWPDSAI